MNSLYPFCNEIGLLVPGRISEEDAARQERTAREILRRLADQPGVILADEVGMGKTFVALAVAVSVAIANKGKRPVVVMVPSSLKEKWPADFSLFREKCLPECLQSKIKAGRAERAVEFLKLLDDPPERSNSLIFLTHGAMSRGLKDVWVILALIRQSLYRRRDANDLRVALGRFMGELLHRKDVTKRDEAVWERLLARHPSEWLKILQGVIEIDDDPVPEAVWRILKELNTDSVYEALYRIPFRRTKHFAENLSAARQVIRNEIRLLWKECLKKMTLQLPLLILDEAHHLKNADTRLNSLFHSEEAEGDAEEISRGPFAGVFERMLFLTATPFQLGHGELCSVLDRFEGISWGQSMEPACGKNGFAERRKELRAALDGAQHAAVNLDFSWGRLKEEDLQAGNRSFSNVEEWWSEARNGLGLTSSAEDVLRSFQRTKERMKNAEKHLRPWVIRHLKPRRMPTGGSTIERRKRLVGKAICSDVGDSDQAGISVSGSALLPFLLAARAASQTPDARPVFAEGLASSFEAYLHTRRKHVDGQDHSESTTDTDDDDTPTVVVDDAVSWYLDQLESLLPRDGKNGSVHPKVEATVRKVVDLWRMGEKAVVFCHYIATGRILRQRISEAIQAEILALGAEKLGCPASEVGGRLDLLGKRFFDQDSPIRQACDSQALQIVREYPLLDDFRDDLIDIVRRNVRTPSFLVRFFPLDGDQFDERAMLLALDGGQPNLNLRILLQQFMRFLVERCGTQDRQRYIDAVKRIQTGSHFGIDVAKEYEDDELQGAGTESLLPNVRLVNGTTRPETRQRLMLGFNTPFFPEVLVASSVMAEGVDLHLNCRFVLHHDLCWNPSTLEQRTGRVDRIGARAEVCGEPICIYLPYIAETQDEKMYRVVMDRERWFNVVMGEDYKVDLRTAEKIASRVPLPASAASELAFDLSVPSAISQDQQTLPRQSAYFGRLSVVMAPEG